MMMLGAVSCAAGQVCSVVCAICMFTVVAYTWLGVCSRGGGAGAQIHDRKYNTIRTIDGSLQYKRSKHVRPE